MIFSQEKVAIIGSGTMGHSIALSAAIAGFHVKVWGVSEQDIEHGKKGVAEKVNVLSDHDVIRKEDAEKVQSSIEFDSSLEKCVNKATFIIECIPEKVELKQRMFQRLEELCASDVIIASNTSGLSPTEIAALLVHPERTLVTHFWNPGHLIPLVEVIRGEQTSNETVERAMQLLKDMNKKPILVQKDILGSIVNRLQYALFREAQYILEQGAATMEDIDQAVRYSIGRRLAVTGPFMTADMGGLDVFDMISSYLFPDLSTHQQSLHTMRTLVDEGKYGQKNGEGFFDWSEDKSRERNKEREQELIRWLKRDLESNKKEK
ncbi:3-hydroxybutyryl-CoA dehydrogenase [Bacillus sp. SA1-12]|uniref:3-hydroxyacyl-CoA dehydrogenase family protein n=1 Tax=Bacillus sp. SA1-12 TaxID=1455638 RepID=UPI0006271EDA|nr:3-hydroxyacyl-CoA dehydrogenase NAD-binding domain-containing protein [Bacillus sp. SA1-12]KKI90469.1 3-hydroxybutyryl-CoA dehydrogenase [Bacillus sp. SA1-12]